jgi:hypothetical protein
MRFHKIVLTGLTAIACLGMASEAVANGRNAGSLLLYPEFDNRVGDVTCLTLTNTSPQYSVTVEYVYIGRKNSTGDPIVCAEFNRLETLTPNDQLTLLTRYHNPQMQQGFVYVFARSSSDQTLVGDPIDFDYLIGSSLQIKAAAGAISSLDYSVNAVAYLGVAPDDAGGNGLRDLNGVEYEVSPGEIQIPRFFGQGNGIDSELILISMTGGAKFTTTIDILFYNDSEDPFSGEYSFDCWDRVYLTDVSMVTTEAFLDSTANDSAEVLGAPSYETGWIRFWGSSASSSSTTLPDPAVYGVLVEQIGTVGGADLPWEAGTNANGKLLARSLGGDF